MSDIKLFRINNGNVVELKGQSVPLEVKLQRIIEKDLETFFGISFLATEYTTGKIHRGRIDTLGIDENEYPVIIEYKRRSDHNVINQGLYYLNWLMDHRAEFTNLVTKKFGQERAERIEWSSPRLFCIAGDFSKFDEFAVREINRNIVLIRYQSYGEEFILFELVTTIDNENNVETSTKSRSPDKSQMEYLVQANSEVTNLYETLKSFIMTLGDDVQLQVTKTYIAFKRIKNFACVKVLSHKLVVFVKVNPETIDLEKDFTRNVGEIGHHGMGNLEITIDSEDDLQKAKELISQSYELN